MPVTQSQINCNVNALRKFGGPVQLDGVEVSGDFCSALKEGQVGGEWVSARHPMCIVADSDVPAAPVGKTLVADGVTFTITEVKADDAGLTILTLRKGL